VSFIPLFEDVPGVTTTGLKWPLDQATLHPGSAYSVSNQIDDSVLAGSVAIEDGVLLAMQS
jgi:thiamine pyrophosphokinase